MDGYQVIKTLGRGAAGVVCSAIEKASGEVVAIKRLEQEFFTLKQCLDQAEIKYLNVLRHENIIRLRKSINEDARLYLVFDYMDCSLGQLITHKLKKGCRFSEQEIRDLCFQVFRGLVHVHGKGYIHRDLKPDNLLINKKENIVTIADFGLATEINPLKNSTDCEGTTWYMAPEVLMMTIYCPKVDMWAMGAIMAELYNLVPLFTGADSVDQMSKISQVIGSPSVHEWSDGISEFNKRLSLSERIPSASNEAINLIGSLLSWDPCKRPTALMALQHPFFNSCDHDAQWIQPTEYKNKIIESTLKQLLGLEKDHRSAVRDRSWLYPRKTGFTLRMQFRCLRLHWMGKCHYEVVSDQTQGTYVARRGKKVQVLSSSLKRRDTRAEVN
ncbi:hypothetical protein ACFE04_029500 [Oxalis oulophora]